MSQRRQRGVRATDKGIELLHTARRSTENGHLTYETIASELKIDPKTVGRFFQGGKIAKENAYSIIRLLQLTNEDILSSDDNLVGETVKKIEEQKLANSERAEALIERLETALSELKQSEEDSLPALEWLKANRYVLAREAAEFALEGSSNQSSDAISENQTDLEQFSQEIRKYLQLVYYCLEEGTWEIMDGAIQQSLIPVNREVTFYTKALTFIKEHKINQNLPSNSIQTIALCLENLIRILPVRF